MFALCLLCIHFVLCLPCLIGVLLLRLIVLLHKEGCLLLLLSTRTAILGMEVLPILDCDQHNTENLNPEAFFQFRDPGLFFYFTVG
jgi:hypothetical protein